MRKKFLLNIMLMLVWVALTGAFTFLDFAFGFALGYIILGLANRDTKGKKYFRLIPTAAGFVLFFLYELIKANIQVAYEVMTPTLHMQPGIVSVPLDVKTDLEITVLANLISLTPGTLSLDVSESREILYVHAMYVLDREEFIFSIKNGFERKVLELLR